jgi:hypothetical protein
MFKRVASFLLIFTSLLIVSSSGDIHVVHPHDDSRPVHAHESGDGSSEPCGGETMLDHLFECIGGISSRELTDEEAASYYPSDETVSIISINDRTSQIKINIFFNEYNPSLPLSFNPHAVASRAPPQPV